MANTSGRHKSPHVALSHPSHPQPLGTTHIRLSHPMRFRSPHFLQNTMGTELEGRCCQPQEFTAHCAHMLKTHWFGFMLNAFSGQNPIGHTAIKGSYPSNRNSVFCCWPGTSDKRAAGASAARLCASAARAPGEPCPHPNEHFACAQHRTMRFQKMTCLRQLSLHPQTQRAHSPGTT